jgi:hypothetical protein
VIDSVINFIFDVSEWVLFHPFWAFMILFAEYAIMFTLYYQKRWRWIAYLMAIPFVIQDAIVNIVALTLFGELPKLTKGEWLVTSRLQRWKAMNPKNGRERFRHGFALRVCEVLGRYDPGHC